MFLTDLTELPDFLIVQTSEESQTGVPSGPRKRAGSTKKCTVIIKACSQRDIFVAWSSIFFGLFFDLFAFVQFSLGVRRPLTTGALSRSERALFPSILFVNFTCDVRSMRKGYVFSCICLSVHRGIPIP